MAMGLSGFSVFRISSRSTRTVVGSVRAPLPLLSFGFGFSPHQHMPQPTRGTSHIRHIHFFVFAVGLIALGPGLCLGSRLSAGQRQRLIL
jgi:hypothetical protein